MPEKAWDILWDDLHHQGDVGEASYAVIPYLVEYARRAQAIPWHVFGFTAVVELERTENRNPPVPAEIELSYRTAIRELPRVGFDRVQAWGEDAFEPFIRAKGPGAYWPGSPPDSTSQTLVADL